MLSIIMLLVVSCSNDDDISITNNTYTPIDLTKSDAEIIDCNNAFALKSFARILENEQNENVIYSPFSAASVISMLANGADGETLAEIEEMMEWDNLHINEINALYKKLIDKLVKIDKATDLSISNALIKKTTINLNQLYTNDLSKYFAAELINLGNNEDINVAVRDWCNKKTKGSISNPFKDINIGNIAILNSMCFDGKWKEPFDKKKTAKGNFTNAKNGIKTVDMMHTSGIYNCAQNEKSTTVMFPYGNCAYSMMIILPNEGSSICEAWSEITTNGMDMIINQMNIYEANISIPKFEVGNRLNLVPTLEQLGLKQLFSDSPNLSRMTEEEIKFKICEQVCHIKTDEDGTKAEVITISSDLASATFYKHITFDANKPFIYVVRENSTGTILLLGSILNL